MHLCRFYSRLPARFEPTIRKLEISILRSFLVRCARAGRQDKVQEFFRSQMDTLLVGPDAAMWRDWLALAYLKAPGREPLFQVGSVGCGCWEQLLQ